MRGIEVPQAPPRSARPPHRAGAFATFEAIENAGVFGWHKVRSTEVAAPTRRSGTARLISLTPKVRFRPRPTCEPDPIQPAGLPRGVTRATLGTWQPEVTHGRSRKTYCTRPGRRARRSGAARGRGVRSHHRRDDCGRCGDLR